MSVTIFHNPRCSKSRQTKALLDELVATKIKPSSIVNIEVFDYLNTPMTVQQLTTLMRQLGYTDARDMMRNNESAYRELGLADETVNNDALLNAIVDNPVLLQRPIVVYDNNAKIGRPPEAVLGLFDAA